MEGTRHPHQAMQPMSPVPSWQQQQYQQSGQQYQEPRLGQPYQQPRLGQQYQQQRFPQNYQQLEFEQQHHSGLGQQYQQPGLLSLPQELGLAQFQPMGFGRQHQQPRLVQPRPSEEYPHIFQHLHKQQQSQHSYDDKPLDHVRQRASIEDQQRSITPNPEQHKEAEIMSLWKDLQQSSKKSVIIPMHSSLDLRHNEETTSVANYSAALPPFSQSSHKETESVKGLLSHERQVETGINIPIGLHGIPAISRSSIDDLNLSNNVNMVPLELSVSRNIASLAATTSGLLAKPLSLKTSHSLNSSHDFTRCDFSDIANLSSSITDPSEGHPRNRHSHDYSPVAGRISTALRHEARPLIREKHSELHSDCNSPHSHSETAPCEDSSLSDSRLVSAVPDDSNPSDSQLDSAVPDDSNLSDDQLDHAPRDYSNPAPCDYSNPAPRDYSNPAPRDYSNPSDDQLGVALHDDSNPSIDPLDAIVHDDSNPIVDPLDSVVRNDSNPQVHSPDSVMHDVGSRPIEPPVTVVRDVCSPSVDPLESVHDDSNPSVDPLDSVVRDDSNPSVDQLESTLCSDPAYPVGSSKGHSRSVSVDDSNLSGDTNLPSKQAAAVSDGCNSSNDKFEGDSANNVSSSVDLSKNRSGQELLNNSSAERLESDVQNSCVSESSPKGKASSTLRGVPITSGHPKAAIVNSRPPSHLEDKPFDGCSQSDSRPKSSLQNDSDSSDSLPRNSVQESAESNSLANFPKTSVQEGSKSSSDDVSKTSLQEYSKASLFGKLHKTSVQKASKSELLDNVPRTSEEKGSGRSDTRIDIASDDSSSSVDRRNTKLNDTPKTPDSRSRVESPINDNSSSLDSEPKPPLTDDSRSPDNQEPIHDDYQPSNDKSEKALSKKTKSSDQTGNSSTLIGPEDLPKPELSSNSSYVKDQSRNKANSTLPKNLTPSQDSSDVKSPSLNAGKPTATINCDPESPGTTRRSLEDSPAHSLLEVEDTTAAKVPAGADADGGFHFVEIESNREKTSTKVVADPLHDDPFDNVQPKSPLPALAQEESKDESNVQNLSTNDDDIQEVSVVSIVNSRDTLNIHGSDYHVATENSNIPEVSSSHNQEAEELLIEESGLSDDDDSTHFFEENYVYGSEDTREATCHVCESNVDISEFKAHLFFGHLQCAFCNRRLVGCDMLQDLEDPKKSVCKKSSTGKHSFKNWTLDPIEFLAYYIRKELVIKKFCAGQSGPPSASEIVEEIQCYVSKLSSLDVYQPWKTAINKCHKYVTDRKLGKTGNKPTTTSTTINKPTVLRTPASFGPGRPSSTQQMIESPSTSVRSTYQSPTVPVNLSAMQEDHFARTSEEAEKGRKTGTVLLQYLGAGLKKSGRYDTASTNAQSYKKQTKTLKICNLKNIVVQAPINGNYLVVHFPSQPCPENCPNCYCQFDPTAVTVNCVTSVITNKCDNCDLTIFVLQDPPDGSVQNVKFRNKRKSSYKFTGPESKKNRMQ
ncbi:serine-rich adhesin for platelets [Procambarus clarkii]|uniref:serine-rich adhesin for platelets n=1 Tax=Procambarus clarkii TaxID=6728 RepID=UPI0037427541